MKKILLAGLFIFGAFNAVAQEEYSDEGTYEIDRYTYETGIGRDSGTCQNSSSSFCVDNIKRRAEDYAKYDARRRCEMAGGRVVNSYYCSTICSPGTIPPGRGNTYVICDAKCQTRCEHSNY